MKASEAQQVGGGQPGARAGLPRRSGIFAHYTFIDYTTQGYMALVGVLILCLHGSAVPLWPALLAAHAVGIGLVHALIQAHAAYPANRVLAFFRYYYPVLFYTGFYRETGELNHMFISDFLDPFFIRLDERLFGFQPSLAFMERLPYLPLSELFYAAYFTYYIMIAGIGLALYLRNRSQFFHYLSVVCFVFYICYLLYIIMPVIGPRVYFQGVTEYRLPPEAEPAVPPAYPETVKAGVCYQIMAWIYRIFEAPGAAFPSSHVAVAIVTVYFSFKYLRRIRWLHLADVVFLCLATVYCRYHYAVDVAAGAVTAAVLMPIGNRLYFKFRESGGIGPGCE